MGTYEYAYIAFGDDLYKEDAMTALADLLDIGVNVCSIEGQKLVDAFVASGLAEHFERQNPAYVAGKSGSELVELLLPFVSAKGPVPERDRFDRSPDYWLGWVLGFYQVETGRSYRRVFETVEYDELVALYHPLHEAPESKFVETLERRMRSADKPTRLRIQRDAARLSQSELARRANVGLRSIQMYEQRNKDIDRAQGATLVRLSRALHCEVEDLLEAG